MAKIETISEKLIDMQTLELTWIENQIVDSLRQAFDNAALGGNTDWTRVEFEALTKLGKALGYHVAHGKQQDKYYGEWLYDLIWYREAFEKQGLKSRLTEFVLAAESEWSYDAAELMTDFQKLLVTNARHRLMVCTVYSEARDQVVAAFDESIQACQNLHKDDRFLIVMLNVNGEDFDSVGLIKE